MIRRTRAHVGLLLLGLGLGISGCGGGPTTLPETTPPPHQGNVFSIPNHTEKVEVVQKPAASKNAPMTGEVSFYFLNKDGKTTIAPPTSGTLELGKKKVELRTEGEALVTPSGPALFAGTGGVDGVLKVELDGKPATIPLGVR